MSGQTVFLHGKSAREAHAIPTHGLKRNFKVARNSLWGRRALLNRKWTGGLQSWETKGKNQQEAYEKAFLGRKEKEAFYAWSDEGDSIEGQTSPGGGRLVASWCVGRRNLWYGNTRKEIKKPFAGGGRSSPAQSGEQFTPRGGSESRRLFRFVQHIEKSGKWKAQ